MSTWAIHHVHVVEPSLSRQETRVVPTFVSYGIRGPDPECGLLKCYGQIGTIVPEVCEPSASNVHKDLMRSVQIATQPPDRPRYSNISRANRFIRSVRPSCVAELTKCRSIFCSANRAFNSGYASDTSGRSALERATISTRSERSLL